MHQDHIFSFEHFYENDLKKELIALDNTRKKILLNYIFIGLVIFTAFVIEAMTWMLVAAFVLIIFVMWYIYQYNFSFLNLSKEIEFLVKNKTSKYLFNTSELYATHHLKLAILQKADIISGDPAFFGGKFLVQIQEKGYKMEISEIQSKVIEKDEHGMETGRVYFNGLAVNTEVLIPLNSEIIIISDELLEHAVSKNIVNHNSKIKNEFITVYYSNQEEYEKLVSPSLLLLCKDYLDNFGYPFILSIRKFGYSIGISKPNHFDYIPLSIFQNIVKQDIAKSYYTDLKFISSINEVILRNVYK